MATLTSLPEDVVHDICDNLDLVDINSLVQTSRCFTLSIKKSLLFHRDLSSRQFEALRFACYFGDRNLLTAALDFGYDPNFNLPFQDERSPLPLDSPTPTDNSDLHPSWSPTSDAKFFITFSPLACAILKGHHQILKELTARGGSLAEMPLTVFDAIGSLQESKISPLHLVKMPAMFQTLLSLDSSLPVDSENTTEYEPLLLWHIERKMETIGIRLLIDAGALPDGSRPENPRLPYHLHEHLYPHHQSPLEAAVYCVDECTTSLLLRRGASFEYMSLDGQNRTSLHCVIPDHIFLAPRRYAKEARATVDVCLRNGMDPNFIYHTWYEIGSGRREFLDWTENLLFHAIILSSNINMLIMLLKAGASLDLPVIMLGRLCDPVICCLEACAFIDPEPAVSYSKQIPEQCEKLAVIASARGFTETIQFMLHHVLGNFAFDQMLPALQAIGHVTSDFHSGSEGNLVVELLERAHNTPGTLYHARETIQFLLKAQAIIMDTYKCTAALGVAFAVPMVSPAVSRDTILQVETDISPSLLPCYGYWGASIDLAAVSISPRMTAERVENGAAIMMALLSAGADPVLYLDQDERTALQLASQSSWASSAAPSIRSVFAYMEQVAEAVTHNRPPPVGFPWDT